jgi:hypothetical protein
MILPRKILYNLFHFHKISVNACIYWYFGGWKRKFVFHISSIKAILTNDKCHLFLNNARVFSNNAGVFCNNTGVLMEELWKRKIPLPS